MPPSAGPSSTKPKPVAGPTMASRGARLGRPVPSLKATRSRSQVSDSEEERRRRTALADVSRSQDGIQNRNRKQDAGHTSGLKVIVIESSDEEEEEDAASTSTSVKAHDGSQQTDVAASQDRPSTPQHRDKHQPSCASDSDSDVEDSPFLTRLRRAGQPSRPRARQLVLSSDSESSESEGEPVARRGAGAAQTTPNSNSRRRPRVVPDEDVIDLTLTSPESDRPVWKERSAVKEKEAGKIPLFLDNSEDEDYDEVAVSPADAFSDDYSDDDDAILTLDEPRSARKPIRIGLPSVSSGLGTPGSTSFPRSAPPKPRPKNAPAPASEDEDNEEDDDEAEVSSLLERPKAKAPSTPRTPGNKSGAPRMTKAALARAEQARRHAYAAALFAELNAGVFAGGLPAGTALLWNKRLLTTAGRAHWRKTREGTHETSIQLAEKILDRDERIRNTLAHEMCHLACWIIDGAPSENHGSLFKSWARKVMRKRPEIEVTTRHSYEIEYKYQWKCSNCAKIYGRHSKSLNPDECVCGVCRVGRLEPQFATRTRAPKTPKPAAQSQNAATRSSDSPLHMPGGFSSPSTPAGGFGATWLIEPVGGGAGDAVDSLVRQLQDIQLAM